MIEPIEKVAIEAMREIENILLNSHESDSRQIDQIFRIVHVTLTEAKLETSGIRE